MRCSTPTSSSGEPRCLVMAVSAAEYILNELYWTDGARRRLQLSAAGIAGPDPQRELPRRRAAVPRLQAHRRHAVPRSGAERRPLLRVEAAGRRVLGLRRGADAALDRQLSHRLQPLRAPRRSAATPATAEFEPARQARARVLPRRTSSARTARRGTSTTAPIRSTFTASRRASSRSSTLKDLDPDNVATGARGLPLGDESHVGRARVLLLPGAPVRHDPDLVHALVAGVDASRAGDAARGVPSRASRSRECRVTRWPVGGREPARRCTYVLITPARNEASVHRADDPVRRGADVQPARWVIVSDGSTDGTDEIVQRYAADHPWIELVRMPERARTAFCREGARVQRRAARRVAGIDYDVIASLDADISLDPDHFAFLLAQAGGGSAAGPGGSAVQGPLRPTTTGS